MEDSFGDLFVIGRTFNSLLLFYLFLKNKREAVLIWCGPILCCYVTLGHAQ